MSCIIGMIGSIIAGGLLGSLSMNYLLGEGGGIFGGIFALAGLGSLFGSFSIMAGLLVVRIYNIINYLKNKKSKNGSKTENELE